MVAHWSDGRPGDGGRVMSVELEKARQQAAEGDYKRAVASLWAVEAKARANSDEARGLLEVATTIRERASGRIQRDCDLLIGHATGDLELATRLEGDPAHDAIAVVRGCRILGGSGLDLEPNAEGRWDLIFRPEHVLLRQARPGGQLVTIAWEGLQLDIDGAGAIRKGGRFFGGGFGLAGAAEGMLIASGSEQPDEQDDYRYRRPGPNAVR